MTQRKRRRLLIFGVILALLVCLYFAATALVAPFLQRRLQQMVASSLNAELHIGHLTYHFPYRITVTDAALVTHGPQGQPVELLKARSVDLRLAELPRAGKPLVIEQLLLAEPTVHLIHFQAGVVGQSGLVKSEKQLTDQPRQKTSDMFRLRRFAADGGRIIYEDRTTPNLTLVVWSGLHLDLHTAPQRDGALYQYRLLAEDGSLATAKAAGSFDVDELHLDVADFSLTVRASPEAGDDKVPGPLQQLLRDNHVRGELKLTGKSNLPFKNLAAAKLDGALDLTNAAAHIPQWDLSLDRVALKLRYSTTPLTLDPTSQPTTAPAAQRPVLYVKLDSLDVGSGETRLVLEKGFATIDADAANWRVRDLLGTLTVGPTHDALPTQLQQFFDQIHSRGKLQFTATAAGPLQPPPGTRAADAIQYELVAILRDFSFQPPTFPLPFEKLTGTVHLQPGLLRLENLSAQYGSDRVFVTAARLPLADVRREIRFEEINGSVDFGGKDEPYPPALAKIFDNIHPAGLFTIAGVCIIQPKEPRHKVEYQLDIAADSARLSPSPKRIPLTAVRGDLKLRGVSGGDSVSDLSNFQAAAFDGTITGSARLTSRLTPEGRLLTYEGRAHAADLNVQSVAKTLAPSGQAPAKATGKGFVDLRFSGAGPQDGRAAADAFRAAGEFEVLEGDFWQVPVITDIVSRTKTKGALTVGQAAATFEIYDKTIDLQNAAVSAPVLGLQGSGQINLDTGQLNLRVVAAPLADWKDKLKSTNIPIVSDAVGTLAGGIQKILNTATRTLLYEFRVTGDVAKPQLTTVPAPVLTEGAAQLFGNMLTPKPDSHLLDLLRPKKGEPK